MIMSSCVTHWRSRIKYNAPPIGQLAVSIRYRVCIDHLETYGLKNISGNTFQQSYNAYYMLYT